MNRYVYMGYYTDKENEKEIYYDSVLDKFYAVPYDFFSRQKDDLEYLLDLLPEDFENPDIKPYEITNKDEIKGLKILVKLNQKNADNNSENTKEGKGNLPKEDDKKEKKYKKAIIGSIVALAAFYLLYQSYNHYGYKVQEKFDEVVESFANKEETKKEYLNKIIDAIELNSTISSEVKQSWINDFTYLFNSDIFMTPSKVNGIAKRISKGEFDNIDEDNYIFVLSNVIFDDDYSIYLGLTNQLDDLANEKDNLNSFESNLFGYLSLGVDSNILKETFLFGQEKYIDILAKNYGVTPEEIKELTDLLDKYYRSDETEKNQYYSEYITKLGNILLKYYQKKDRLSEYDQFVLVSDIYNDGINTASDIFKTLDITNNLFSDYIVIHIRDIPYGHYNLYFDSKTHTDITPLIYQEKLIDLLKNKGENLDYNDPDARFLVYLYVLAYEDKFTMKEKKELFSSQNAEELTSYIIDSIFDNNYAIKMNLEFLYGYFSNGKINFKEMIDEIYGFSDDALSISLFIEYERCLKHEVLEGRLSEEEYQEQYDKLKKLIAWWNDEIIDFVEDAINNDESMFTDFYLPFSNIEYANDEIKKYTYENEVY